VLLNAGQFAFHHKLTFHGSHPNTSGRPRRSFAIHMRTEKSWPKKGEESVYTADLTDQDMNSVIYATELPS
jgi:ectoine hydroxylase-related dioxygenase (phytanoyl-CoA dioxygenase family)